MSGRSGTAWGCLFTINLRTPPRSESFYSLDKPYPAHSASCGDHTRARPSSAVFAHPKSGARTTGGLPGVYHVHQTPLRALRMLYRPLSPPNMGLDKGRGGKIANHSRCLDGHARTRAHDARRPCLALGSRGLARGAALCARGSQDRLIREKIHFSRPLAAARTLES